MRPTPLPPWTDAWSDGCTDAPDQVGRWSLRPCCVAHDRAYYYGGTPADRQAADAALYVCLTRVFGVPTAVAWAYWLAVRAFGWRRWGARHPVRVALRRLRMG